MTKANMNKMILSMAKAMMYCYDVQHVSRSVISDEFYDNKDGRYIKSIGECFSVKNGLWHIECDECCKSIWFYKTMHNDAGKAIGYCPKWWIDTTDLKQFDICGEIGYYLMQIMNDMKRGENA